MAPAVIVSSTSRNRNPDNNTTVSPASQPLQPTCCNENVHIVSKVLQEEMKNGVLRMKEVADGKKSRCITRVALCVEP